MQWHRHNSRRKREANPYLGDVIGEPLPPMTLPARKHPCGRWIERGLPKVFGFVALGLFFALVSVACVLAYQVIITPPDMTGR